MTFIKSEYDAGSNTSSPDDAMSIDNKQELPLREGQPPPPQYPLTLDLHSIRQEEKLLVSINPPRQPENDIKHVPCDIVLVIDVSGSMASAAPMPDTQNTPDTEASGLSILDLTKHAARTILETLDKNDRLAIVTFSYNARVVQPLIHMTKKAKKETDAKIEQLVDEGATNLWDGIRTGLKVFEETEFNGNVQGLYVLTDGMPNHMCPKQGYVAKLKPLLKEMAHSRPCIPTIHTFGFGYDILSNLLQSIAEVGHGSYAFIPDTGMIGTVFVHAVANLFTTYATSATLKLVTARNCRLVCSSGHDIENTSSATAVMSLGNIQYGQSRDIVLSAAIGNTNGLVKATLEYKLVDGTVQTTQASVSLREDTDLPQSVVDYHLHRNTICTFLSSLFPIGDNGEHLRRDGADAKVNQAGLADTLTAMESLTPNPTDEDIISLFNDLRPSSDTASDGQITHALTSTTAKPYWKKWGKHYLPSLLHAHLAQQCNSFKDPGPLRYGMNSPLFIKCREGLDAAFDNLPAPKPSLAKYYAARGVRSAAHGSFKMSRFNYVGNPCFLGACTARLADGQTTLVQDLRPGMCISNMLTGKEREIVAVVKTNTVNKDAASKQQICRVGETGLWITPYHPILHSTPGSPWKWVFPTAVADQTRSLADNEAVYSILLEPSTNPDDHVIQINGFHCTTLGHGLTQPEHNTDTTNMDVDVDVRNHVFLGDYSSVIHNLALLPRDDKGHSLSAGIQKDPTTGLACRFLPPPLDADPNINIDTNMIDQMGSVPTPAPASTRTINTALPSAIVVDYEGEGEYVWWREQVQSALRHGEVVAA